jgi:hypothetical protein
MRPRAFLFPAFPDCRINFRGKCRAIKKPTQCTGSALIARELLLAAGFFQHTQGALVSLVSGLLGFLSGGQSFVSLAVGFVSTGLSAGSCVFGSGQTGFGFFGYAAATGGQNCGNSPSLGN